MLRGLLGLVGHGGKNISGSSGPNHGSCASNYILTVHSTAQISTAIKGNMALKY